MKVTVKEWFINNNYYDSKRYAINEIGNEFTITGETEKAYKGFYDTNYGKINAFVPKKCVYTKEEIQENTNRIINAKKRYEAMINFCKENGIKVRTGFKKETILEKIAEAGLTFTY